MMSDISDFGDLGWVVGFVNFIRRSLVAAGLSFGLVVRLKSLNTGRTKAPRHKLLAGRRL